MSRSKVNLAAEPAPVPAPPVAQPTESQWAPEVLVAVAHLGPGVIGKEMYAAAQAYVTSSANGVLGPATRGETK